MRTVILTGFEPFGPHQYNPAQDLAREYDGKTIGDMNVKGLVLPSTYYGAFDTLSKRIEELRPEKILSIGLATSAETVKLETRGRNIMNGKYADANGMKPENVPIIAQDLETYETTADYMRVSQILKDKNIPVEVSVDAGNFICNSLTYLTARKIHTEGIAIKYIHIHIPWTEDYLGLVPIEPGKITLSKDTLRKTIDILLKEM